MYLLLILIFILFLMGQLILAISSWNLRHKLPKRFANHLGSQIEVSELLEKYIKKKAFKLKAVSKLDNIVVIYNDTLLIDKKAIYKKDLYTNFYVIFIVNLLKSANTLLISLSQYQNLIFFFELLLFFLALFFQNYNFGIILLICAIIIEIFAYIFCLFVIQKLIPIIKTTNKEAKKFLKLDDVEEARAEVLGSELKYLVFEYPFDIVWRIVEFLKP